MGKIRTQTCYIKNYEMIYEYMENVKNVFIYGENKLL